MLVPQQSQAGPPEAGIEATSGTQDVRQGLTLVKEGVGSSTGTGGNPAVVQPPEPWPTSQGAPEGVLSIRDSHQVKTTRSVYNHLSQAPNAGCPRKGLILGKTALCS